MTQTSPTPDSRTKATPGREKESQGIKRTSLPILIPIHNRWEQRMYIGAGADEQEDDEQEALEVEKGGLNKVYSQHPCM